MNAAQIFTMPLAGAVMPEMAATDTTAAASTVSDADIFGSLFGSMLDNQAEQKESASAENTELQKQPEFKTVLPKQLDTRLLMQEEAGAVQMAEMVSAAFTAYQQPVVQDDVVEDAEQLQDKTVEATTPKVEATTPKVEVTTPKVEATTPKVAVTTPKVEATTPKVEVTTPKVEVTTPKVEATTPKVEATAPKVEATTPKVEATTPKVEATTPKVEATTPKVEATTPKVEATTPKVEVTTPKVEVTAPKVEATTAKVEVTTPKVEAPTPKVEATTPKVEATIPKVEATTPKVEVTTPKVEVTTPKVEVTTPKVEATTPKVEATTPKVEATTPKVEATTPKVEATTPKVEVITRQPVQEQQETTQHNKPATAWWGYEKPVQQQATVNDVNQPQHPAQTAKVVDIQPKSVGQQTTAVTAESTEPAVKDVTRLQTVEAAIEKSDNSNTHNLAASGNTNRIHAEAVSQPEKGAETNRQATQEQQVYKQFSDQLSKHDFKQGAERVSFTLHPENLGKLHLNFQMEQQNLRVEIVAENRIARDSLMQQIDQVKESLARQNINLEKFDVSTSDGRMFQQHQQPSQQRNLYGSLYGHQPGSNKAVNGNGTATADGYQLSDAVQYFAPQYESTFNYQA